MVPEVEEGQPPQEGYDQRIDVPQTADYYAVDGDGTTLAVAEYDPDRSAHGITLVEQATHAATRLVLPAGAEAFGPTLSDDGRTVVFSLGTSTGTAANAPRRWEVWAASGGAPRRIGDFGDGRFGPPVALSGDGTRAAWYRYDDATKKWSAWTVDLTAAGAVPVKVSETADSSYDPTYAASRSFPGPALSTDGRVLLVDEQDDYTSPLKVLRLTSDGTWNRTAVPVFHGSRALVGSLRSATLSGDGRSVVFGFAGVSSTYRPLPAQVWSYDVELDRLALVTAAPTAADGNGDSTYPSVSRDGGVVAFISAASDLVAGDTGGFTDVFVGRPRAASATPAFAPGAALSLTGITSSSATLTWPAATDDVAVVSYQVLVDGVSRSSHAPDVRSTTLTGLVGARAYTVSVRAIDGDQQRAVLEATLRTAATTLDAFATGARTVQLQWQQSADAAVTGYRVLRRRGAGAEVTVVDLPPTTISHADSGLAADTDYAYRVQALVGSSARDHAGPAGVRTLSSQDQLLADPSRRGGITLTWSAASPGASYTVLRGPSADQLATLTTTPLTALSYRDSTVTPGTTYVYRVDLQEGDQRTAHTSTVTATAARLSSLGAVARQEGGVSVSWETADGPVRVLRAVGAGPFTTLVDVPSGNSTVDTSTLSATTYRYRVDRLDGRPRRRTRTSRA